MGYTHYFRHPRGIHTDFASRMPAIAADATAILNIAKLIVASPDGIPESAPVVNLTQIAFNGVRPDDYQGFSYPPDQNLARPPHSSADLFDWCKTDRCPYDAAVVATLLAIQDHMGDDITLHTDAIPHDRIDEPLMAQGVALYNQAFPQRAITNWLTRFNPMSG